MDEDNRSYIAPNLIGDHRITTEEKEIICKRKIKRVPFLIVELLIVLVLVFWFCFFHKDAWFYFINLAIYAGVIIVEFLSAKSGKFHYQNAAYGTVVKKEILYQVVPQGFDEELFPFQRPGMPGYHEKAAGYYSGMQERAFYYLTVQLQQDATQFVRYVNCTQTDYDALRKGDEVLVVNYGDERIIGYYMKTSP